MQRSSDAARTAPTALTFPAELLLNQRISGRDFKGPRFGQHGAADKDVRHIELSLEGSGLHYEPGDALGVRHRNPAALVDGTLGNRVTITRTNPATGKAEFLPAEVIAAIRRSVPGTQRLEFGDVHFLDVGEVRDVALGRAHALGQPRGSRWVTPCASSSTKASKCSSVAARSPCAAFIRLRRPVEVMAAW